MGVPHNFARKLYEVLGPEAAESIVDWMTRSDDNLSALRRQIAEFRQTVRADFAELRQEMNGKFSALEVSLAQRHSDFMKWTLGFWAISLITLIGAILGFAVVLR